MGEIYNIATLWIIIGSLALIMHNVYVWDVCSDDFKKEITTIRFLIACVIAWPVILFIVIRIIVDVEIKFRKWKKENDIYL